MDVYKALTKQGIVTLLEKANRTEIGVNETQIRLIQGITGIDTCDCPDSECPIIEKENNLSHLYVEYIEGNLKTTDVEVVASILYQIMYYPAVCIHPIK